MQISVESVSKQHSGSVSNRWINSSTPPDFSTPLFGIILNLGLCALQLQTRLQLCFGNSACLDMWSLPLSGSTPRRLQSCVWWSVPAQGSWGRGEAAGTAWGGQRAPRTVFLLVSQLERKRRHSVKTHANLYWHLCFVIALFLSLWSTLNFSSSFTMWAYSGGL